MEKAERDLNSALTHERFAGMDWAKIRAIGRDVLKALNHLHLKVSLWLPFPHGTLCPSASSSAYPTLSYLCSTIVHHLIRSDATAALQ